MTRKRRGDKTIRRLKGHEPYKTIINGGRLSTTISHYLPPFSGTWFPSPPISQPGWVRKQGLLRISFVCLECNTLETFANHNDRFASDVFFGFFEGMNCGPYAARTPLPSPFAIAGQPKQRFAVGVLSIQCTTQGSLKSVRFNAERTRNRTSNRALNAILQAPSIKAGRFLAALRRLGPD